MDKKRILIVTQDLAPYTTESDAANLVRSLVSEIPKNDMDVRILMPRFGMINERRHRLHEVVRLSGINIIIDDDDYPLVIKVASIPNARLQVYFLDNEDFFRQKIITKNDKGELFSESVSRTVFFCRGVLETVKKFGWAPDIIHCHGWMSSLLPLFIKTAYKKDPIFENSQLVYSIYENEFDGILPTDFATKAQINRVKAEDLVPYKEATNTDLHLGALHYSDAAIVGAENIDETVSAKLDELETPKLAYAGEDFLTSYMDFYKTLIGEEEGEVTEK